MAEIPVSAVEAEYRGKRLPIVFSGKDWVALQAGADVEVPDAIAYGEAPVGDGHYESWAKVPWSAVSAVIDVDVTGVLSGHRVSLRGRMPDGRIRVWFIGSPAIARQIGMEGDQYMGWSGLFEPEVFEDIEVRETRRA